MWLLDVNMPLQSADLLRQLGIEAATAQSRGWGGYTNGELVEAAVRAGFTCILTRDRLFSESAARSLERFSSFCVVLVAIPQLRAVEFLVKFREAWERNPIQIVAGTSLIWPREG